jgi:hypothetical protein
LIGHTLKRLLIREILRFVDRDMIMRFHWGLGVGHLYTRMAGLNELLVTAASEALIDNHTGDLRMISEPCRDIQVATGTIQQSLTREPRQGQLITTTDPENCNALHNADESMHDVQYTENHDLCGNPAKKNHNQDTSDTESDHASINLNGEDEEYDPELGDGMMAEEDVGFWEDMYGGEALYTLDLFSYD